MNGLKISGIRNITETRCSRYEAAEGRTSSELRTNVELIDFLKFIKP